MFSIDYLNEMINPSNWARKSQGSVRIQEHIKIIEKYSKEVLKSIPYKLSIPYGTGLREIIYIFGTDLPEGTPILIHFHGGYWQETSVRAENNIFIAKHLYKHKIKTIFVGYELCPDVTLSKIRENVAKALTKCLEYAKKCNTRKIFLSGHSAGGQIVVMFFNSFISNLSAEDQFLFKKTFLLAGVFDLITVQQTSLNDLLKLDEMSAVKESPLHQNLKPSYCKLIFVVAKYDCPKLIQQAEDMYKYATKLGFTTEYNFMKNMDHFDIVENLYDENSELTKLFIKHCTKN